LALHCNFAKRQPKFFVIRVENLHHSVRKKIHKIPDQAAQFGVEMLEKEAGPQIKEVASLLAATSLSRLLFF
jgi:hypothetical protein